MLRKLALAVPVLGAFALSAPGVHHSAQAAQFSPALDAGLTPLVELVGRRGGGGGGGGGHVFRGGGGGGGGWGRGGGGGFRGGGGGGFRGGMSGGGRSFGGNRGFSSGRSFSGPRSFSSGRSFSGARSFDGPRIGRSGVGGGDIGRRWNRGYAGNIDRGNRPGVRGGEWRRGRHGNWRHRRHHRRFVGFGSGFYLSDPYYYDSDCTWLRERAVDTGSAYWWRRYRYCLDGAY